MQLTISDTNSYKSCSDSLRILSSSASGLMSSFQVLIEAFNKLIVDKIFQILTFFTNKIKIFHRSFACTSRILTPHYLFGTETLKRIVSLFHKKIFNKGCNKLERNDKSNICLLAQGEFLRISVLQTLSILQPIQKLL